MGRPPFRLGFVVSSSSSFIMNTPRLLPLALALLLSTPAALAQTPPPAAAGAAIGWDSVPGILARIKAPQFPARDLDRKSVV